MAWNEVLERFIKESPVPVMARLILQEAIPARWVDEIFEKHSESQYTRELLFSTTVNLMSQVALGFRKSLHSAAQGHKDLGVSITSVYNKVNHAEPQVIRALTQGSAERLTPIVLPLQKGKEPLLPGYRVRVVDGNHLPATEKRLKVLRGFRGAALPGYSLVVYDPDLGLIVDQEPCECAHAQERTQMNSVIQRGPKGCVWVCDRNLCTSPILFGIRNQDGLFAIREHAANPNPTVRSKWKKRGRTETGMVYEQKVSIEDEEGRELLMRRIKLVLDEPTEDGEREIRILTNLPREVTAQQVARWYRKRWTIEGMFQRLESVVKSEVRTLGYPKGALLAFGVSVLAYNVLSVIQTAVEAAHDLEAEGVEISPYYIAEETRAFYEGMRIAVLPKVWAQFERKSPRQLSQDLLILARHIVPTTLRNHRRSKPKIRSKKGYAPGRAVRRHISTAKALLSGRIE